MWSKEKVLFYVAIFAVCWAAALTMFYNELVALPSIWQYLLITGVLFALPSVVFGRIMINNGDWIKYSLGAFLLITSFDLLAPPLVVGMDGVVNTSSTLAAACPDMVVAGLWGGLGVSGNLLWIFVYPVSFIVLFAFAAFLLTKRQLWEILSKH